MQKDAAECKLGYDKGGKNPGSTFFFRFCFFYSNMFVSNELLHNAKAIHCTTVDLSLEELLLPQLILQTGEIQQHFKILISYLMSNIKFIFQKCSSYSPLLFCF